MLCPASKVSDAPMLYSPTPMKRRSSKKTKSPRRRKKETGSGLTVPDMSSDDGSKKSNQDSLSSKLGSTVGTVTTAGMDSENSDSDCDTKSFFSEAFSAISELPEALEGGGSPHRSDAEESPKKRKKKKKKKKKDKSLKSPNSPKAPKSPKKKKKKERSPKSEKSPKKKVKPEKPKKKKDKSGKSPKKSKGRKSKKRAKEDSGNQSDSDADSFLGESFRGAHLVVPQIQQQEESAEDFPGGPPLWGETDEEKSCADVWEEDKSWNGWEENDDMSQYIEETICDESHDGFSYYTIQSNEDLDEMNLGLDFPEPEDIEDDEVTESTARSELTGKSEFDKRSSSEKKRVCFNECETVHETLHICDFTQKEIGRSWYQQKDYEETIQGVKEVACSSETPRDTQTRLRRQRSLLSKTAETRGLEAWTPSGVQRFRYVKEAAFRAVWDEQQKQLDLEDDESDISTVNENQKKLREAYERVSQKSIKEAHMRAKKDEEIASKLQPRLKRLGSQRGGWEKSMGSSGRRLLDGSSHGLSDNPAVPPTCFLRRENPNAEELSQTEHGKRQLSLGLFNMHSERGDRSPFKKKSERSLFRQSSDRSLFKKKSERGLFRQMSDRALFKDKPERGVFRQSSDRSLFKKKLERGVFRQSSDRSLFKKKPERGVFRQSSDRSLFKKKPGLGLFKNIRTQSQ